MENKIIISPKTKVFEILETYPQLEDLLISFVPALNKLKNPMIRNTISKITNLQQAASIGNLQVEQLINLLRKEVGQNEVFVADQKQTNPDTPFWFDIQKISVITDVRAMLNAGEHPVNLVISELKLLEKDKIYQLIVPFIPAPLIDKAESIGFTHYIVGSQDDVFNVYFFNK